MSGQNRILVVVDPTAPSDQAAVSRARFLAQKLGLGLELVICYYDPYLGNENYLNTPRLENSRREIVRHLKNKLDQIAGPLLDEGLDVQTTAIWDRPLDEAIIRHTLRTKPRIVMKESHYHNKISRTLFTHTDWNLVRNCPAPLWFAKKKDWAPKPAILAAVDPMQEHDKPATLDGLILNISDMLARDLDCELHVFHSYVPRQMLAADTMVPMAYAMTDVDDDLEREHSTRLTGVIRGHSVAENGIHLMTGHTEKLLPDVAAGIRAGVVVMGAVARSSIKRVFIGSTAEGVLPTLDCDLLIIKPQWFVSSIVEDHPQIYESTRGNL